MSATEKNNQELSPNNELVYGTLQSVKRLVQLYLESAKLKTTEKITVLLSSIAFIGVIIALGLVCLVFISIGIGHILATTIAPHLAYLIVAAFYLVLFALTIALKRQIFIDPISCFMSRLLVEEPEDERHRTIVGDKSILPSEFESKDSDNDEQ